MHDLWKMKAVWRSIVFVLVFSVKEADIIEVLRITGLGIHGCSRILSSRLCSPSQRPKRSHRTVVAAEAELSHIRGSTRDARGSHHGHINMASPCKRRVSEAASTTHKHTVTEPFPL